MTGGVLVAGGLVGVVAAVTWIEKAGNDVISTPSEALMTMLEIVPTLPAAGCPARTPVAASKVTHDGAFWMVNTSVSPSGSDACGAKL